MFMSNISSFEYINPLFFAAISVNLYRMNIFLQGTHGELGPKNLHRSV